MSGCRKPGKETLFLQGISRCQIKQDYECCVQIPVQRNSGNIIKKHKNNTDTDAQEYKKLQVFFTETAYKPE